MPPRCDICSFCLGRLFTTVSASPSAVVNVPAQALRLMLAVRREHRYSAPPLIGFFARDDILHNRIALNRISYSIPMHAFGTIKRSIDNWCNSLTLSLQNLTTHLGRYRKGLQKKDLNHQTPAIPPQKTKPGMVPFGRLRARLLMPLWSLVQLFGMYVYAYKARRETLPGPCLAYKPLGCSWCHALMGSMAQRAWQVCF